MTFLTFIFVITLLFIADQKLNINKIIFLLYSERILNFLSCTVNSKINGIPKGVYMPISKLHSILAVPNLFAHNKA